MTLDTKAIEAELAAANMDAAGQRRRQAKSWTHVRDLLARVKVLEDWTDFLFSAVDKMQADQAPGHVRDLLDENAELCKRWTNAHYAAGEARREAANLLARVKELEEENRMYANQRATLRLKGFD